MAYAPHSELGEYRLVAHLGRGGMGDVYRATHRRLGRTVALKVLRDPALAARFLSEARIQGGLSHPHIATLYDYFEAAGQACIVMELVEGDTLADRLRQRGPVGFAEALGLLRPVAEAVAYLHAHGIIHRDLKSHNVKVTPGGAVKLLDFGIAKELGTQGLTMAGMVPGTPEYLSPEQVQGRPPDARSDVWALGVLLYELVTGDVPFQAPSAFELFQRITRAEYAPPSTRAAGLPPACDALVARCLRANPDHRFADAGALLAALPAETPRTAPARAAAPAVSAPLPAAVRPLLALRQQSERTLRRNGAGLALPRSSALGYGLLGLGAVGLLLVALFTFGRPAGPVEGPATPRVVPPSAVPHQIIISTRDGRPAEVYRDGQRLGPTPYTLDTYAGERVELVLRAGAVEQPVEFVTTVNKSAWSFSLPRP